MTAFLKDTSLISDGLQWLLVPAALTLHHMAAVGLGVSASCHEACLYENLAARPMLTGAACP